MKEKIKPTLQQTTRKVKEERVPWYAKLAVKDLVNPITLSRVRLVQLGVAFMILSVTSYYVWDNFLRQPTGYELLGGMLEAAGGMETWNGIKDGQFTRTQYLYGMNGELLSEIPQTFYFRKTQEGLQLKVTSQTPEGEKVQISKDKDGYWATKAELPADPRLTSGDLGMMCDSKYCNPDCAASMAFYRFSMPFKLTDAGVRPDLGSNTDFKIIDTEPLEEFFGLNTKPQVLDVGFKPTVGKDRWKFYVHPETKLIYKIAYYNKPDIGNYRPEELFWTDHRQVDGLTISHQWHRYWSNGKIMEKYVFSDVNLNANFTADFFERPEGHQLLSAK